jgi:hypothetical protein
VPAGTKIDILDEISATASRGSARVERRELEFLAGFRLEASARDVLR